MEGNDMKIYAQLAEIQSQMHAPKKKTNTFGKYKYRTAEGILAAFKSLGVEGAALTCSDTMQEVAGQIFVTATATLLIGEDFIQTQGHAMHPLEKKGMDASQITGTASSYARKYALNGLFAIEDESQDVDSMDNREQSKVPQMSVADACKILASAPSSDLLTVSFQQLSAHLKTNKEVLEAGFMRRKQLENADLGGDELPTFEGAK